EDIEEANPIHKRPLTDQEVNKNKNRNLLEESSADKKVAIKRLTQKPDSETTIKDRNLIIPVEPIHPSLPGLAIHPPFLLQENNPMPGDPLREKNKEKALTLGIAFTPMMSTTET